MGSKGEEGERAGKGKEKERREEGEERGGGGKKEWKA